MYSTDTREAGSGYSACPVSGAFCFQSSQPHLKKFIMFDQSGGKGRVFLHPALAQELFGPSGHQSQQSKIENAAKVPSFCMGGAESNLVAYREMVAGAFASLQSLRNARNNNPVSLGQLPNSKLGVCSATSSFSRDADVPQLSGSKRASELSVSSSMHENSEDLDALLSSDDYDDEDDDDDVRSTGHSPDELSAEESCDINEEKPSKRRKSDDLKLPVELNKNLMMTKEGEVMGKAAGILHQTMPTSTRRNKIKKTVKALRKMIPGGALLDPALVLDETIHYVKALRARVNHLEATRFHPQE